MDHVAGHVEVDFGFIFGSCSKPFSGMLKSCLCHCWIMLRILFFESFLGHVDGHIGIMLKSCLGHVEGHFWVTLRVMVRVMLGSFSVQLKVM